MQYRRPIPMVSDEDSSDSNQSEQEGRVEGVHRPLQISSSDLSSSDDERSDSGGEDDGGGGGGPRRLASNDPRKPRYPEEAEPHNAEVDRPENVKSVLQYVRGIFRIADTCPGLSWVSASENIIAKLIIDNSFSHSDTCPES